MKKLLAIGLSFLILSSSFKDMILLADFYINRSFIERILCVNRNDETLQCHGKCYLNKQLQQAEQREKQNPVEKKEISGASIFLFFSEQWSDLSLPAEARSAPINPAQFYSCNFRSQVFHPPPLT